MSEPIDRRTFIRRSAIAVLGVTAAGLGVVGYVQRRRVPWDRAAFGPIPDARVAVVRAESYSGSLEETVFDGLRAVGAELRGARVLLKPNLVEFDPGTTVNTDPRLIGATVVAARRLGATEVVVAEGPGHRRDTQFVLTATGLASTLADVDAAFIDLNTDAVVARRLRSHYTTLGRLALPRSVVDADVVISMPKMKTHHWAGVTLSLKNCFGCVPGRIYGWPKNALHLVGIEQAILDVAAAVRPDLAIVDGIEGMEGNGPISGSPVASGVLVFGNDPVATDVVAARVMNVDPERVPYLVEAGRFLGQADLERIRMEGEDPERLALDFALLPSFEYLRVGSSAEPIPPPDAPG